MILLTIAFVWSRFQQKKNAIFDYKKRCLQKLHRWIWAFCSDIDMCIVHLHFLRGMNLQFSTIAVRMHFFMFYVQIYAYFGVWFMSIGVEFVLGTKRTLKWNLNIIRRKDNFIQRTEASRRKLITYNSWKKYQSTMTEHRNFYLQKVQNNIRKMTTDKPKDYWKLINIIDRKHDESPISM